jgi:hypothetical protein
LVIDVMVRAVPGVPAMPNLVPWAEIAVEGMEFSSDAPRTRE